MNVVSVLYTHSLFFTLFLVRSPSLSDRWKIRHRSTCTLAPRSNWIAGDSESGRKGKEKEREREKGKRNGGRGGREDREGDDSEANIPMDWSQSEDRDRVHGRYKSNHFSDESFYPLIQYYIIQSRSLNNFKDHSTLIISNMQLLQYIILIEDHLSFFLLHWNIWFLLCTYKYYVVFEAINLRTSWIYVIYSFKLDDKRLCKLLVKIFSLFSLVYWIE